MIKYISLAAVGCTMLTGIAIADQPGFAKDGDINICTSANFPPITYKQNPGDATPVGIDVDIIEAIGDLWNVEVSYTIGEFGGLLPTLGSGRCDMIASGMYVTDKRRATYNAVRYMKSATVIVTKADNTTINSPEDLSGKVLALESGSYYQEEQVDPLNVQLSAAGSAPIEVQAYPAQQGAYQQVLGGRADATMTEEAEGGFRVASMSGDLRIAYTYDSAFTFGMYIRPDSSDLAAIKAALTTLREDGFFSTLAEKYGVSPTVFDVDYDS